MRSRERFVGIPTPRGLTTLPNFSDLGLSAPILGALAAEGYVAPTPIQFRAIPPVLRGRDLCGIAQTGTGKTAAFALPILQRLAAIPRRAAPQTCRALVLSPTRELASQIADSFRAYGAGIPLSTAVVFGGASIGPQRQKLARGVDILVATPGRLLDLIDSRSLTLSSVQVLVLDEADRMLDLGFVHALKRIVKLLPRPRQTLLFSATMPRPIAALAEDYLNDPVEVIVAPSATTAERVEQRVVFVSSDVRHLVSAGIQATAIHGNKSQPQRERALAGFRDGQTRVLVATDIAARGIDVDGVSHVINFELPNVLEDYVHRIGRTARAGAAGIAIAFCSDDERPYLRDIEKLTRCSLRATPALSAPRAPRHGPSERSASIKLPPEGSLASRQAPVSGRASPAAHPPRPASDEFRGGEPPEPPAAGAPPAFLRRPSRIKPRWAGRRGGQRGRSAAARFNSAR
jgi:ATP-dependent RNA helicase RhlE